MTRADLFTLAILASGREVTQSDLDRALKAGRWMAGQTDVDGLVKAALRLVELYDEAMRELMGVDVHHGHPDSMEMAEIRLAVGAPPLAALAEYEARG